MLNICFHSGLIDFFLVGLSILCSRLLCVFYELTIAAHSHTIESCKHILFHSCFLHNEIWLMYYMLMLMLSESRRQVFGRTLSLSICLWFSSIHEWLMGNNAKHHQFNKWESKESLYRWGMFEFVFDVATENMLCLSCLWLCWGIYKIPPFKHIFMIIYHWMYHATISTSFYSIPIYKYVSFIYYKLKFHRFVVFLSGLYCYLIVVAYVRLNPLLVDTQKSSQGNKLSSMLCYILYLYYTLPWNAWIRIRFPSTKSRCLCL